MSTLFTAMVINTIIFYCGVLLIGGKRQDRCFTGCNGCYSSLLYKNGAFIKYYQEVKPSKKKGFFLFFPLFHKLYITGMDYSHLGKTKFVLVPDVYLFMAIYFVFPAGIIIKLSKLPLTL